MLMVVIYLGDNIKTIKKNTAALVEGSQEVGLGANTEKTKYILYLVTSMQSNIMT
jgi:hypothetical protein